MYVYIHLDEVFFENHPTEGKGKEGEMRRRQNRNVFTFWREISINNSRFEDSVSPFVICRRK